MEYRYCDIRRTFPASLSARNINRKHVVDRSSTTHAQTVTHMGDPGVARARSRAPEIKSNNVWPSKNVCFLKTSID